MLPPGCPVWEYEAFSKSDDLLKGRLHVTLFRMRSGLLARDLPAQDTKDQHLFLFRGLTPSDCDYYAGHYRGESSRCLENYEVRIVGDPFVGSSASLVGLNIVALKDDARGILAALDQAFQIPEVNVSNAEKVYYLVASACRLFVEFLRIHPYANGNGRASFCSHCVPDTEFGHALGRFTLARKTRHIAKQYFSTEEEIEGFLRRSY